MSRTYILLLGFTAFLIAAIGASFSIAGLAQLFAGADVSVAVMAGSLEFAKLVVTGFLYRYWGHINRPMRVYLTAATVTLVGITSVGIFGYLSNAYQKSSVQHKSQNLKIAGLDGEYQRVQNRIKDIQKFIDEIPRSRISRKLEFQKKYDPEVRRLQSRSEKIMVEIDKMRLEILNTQVKIGPAVYLAQALGTDVDTVVKYLILVFVMVFDPLAVCLVFCLSLAIRLREKYKGNEVKIGAHALSTPVDHRFKKSA